MALAGATSALCHPFPTKGMLKPAQGRVLLVSRGCWKADGDISAERRQPSPSITPRQPGVPWSVADGIDVPSPPQSRCGRGWSCQSFLLITPCVPPGQLQESLVCCCKSWVSKHLSELIEYEMESKVGVWQQM